MRKAIFVFLILDLIGFVGFSQSQLSEVDLSKIQTLKDSVLFDNAITNLQELVNEEQFESAQSIADKLVTLGGDIGYGQGLGDVFRLKGIISNEFQRKIESDKNFEKAIYYYEKIDDLRGLSIIGNDRFSIERHIGNLENAANYLLESKLYREQLNDSVGLSRMYNNLGNIYKELKNIPDSEKYFLKSIDLRKQLKMDGLGLVMNNLSLLYTENGSLLKAKKLLTEALKINKAENDLKLMAQSYSIMAKATMYSKEYEKAKKYYDTTLSVGNKANYKLFVVIAKQQLGIIALEQGEYQKASELLKISREGFVKLNMVSFLLKNYKFSFKLDSTKGDLLSAIRWQKEYQELSDMRMDDITSKKVEKNKLRYEAELKQLKLIDEQEKREQKTKDELFKHELVTFISLLVLVVILIFMVLFMKSRKERKKYIEELNESNEIKNKLFSIISHDLKNEIHGLESSLNLMKEDVISTEEFKEIVPLLANRTHQTSILLNNLLNWSKSQMKELNAKPIAFDVNDVISSKFVFFKSKADKKNIQLINNLDTTKILADKDMVGIVAQNLIANAIKFCNPGDSIVLKSVEKENYYEICFEDTGIGIDPTNLNKLFAEDTFTTCGTHNETGTGLGLKICKELIELNQGNIMVKSTPGEGSVFCISLPKAA